MGSGITALAVTVSTFTFIEAVIFMPTAFADAAFIASLGIESNGRTLVPALIVLAIAVFGLALSAVGRASRKADRALMTVCACVLPLVTLLAAIRALALTPSDVPLSSIPVLFSVLAGITVMAQARDFAHSSELDSPGTFLVTGIGIPISLVLSCALLASGLSPMQGFVGIVTLQCLAGAALLVDARKTANRKRAMGDCGSDAATEESGGTESFATITHAIRQSGLLPAITLLAIEVSLGTVNLGFMWEAVPLSQLAESPLLIVPIVALEVGFVLLVHMIWRRMRDVRVLLVAGTAPFVVSVAVSVLGVDAPNWALLTINVLANQLFLLTVWTSSLVIGRAVSSTDSIATGSMVLLLILFSVCLGLSGKVDREAVRVVAPLLDLALVAVLPTVSTSWKLPDARGGQNRADAGGNAKPTSSSLIADGISVRCKEISEAAHLSAREAEILPLLVLGLSAKEIGQRILISPKTVSTYRYRIYAKVGVHSHDELIELVGI
jgi:DNA-binding CsgD family transcriptional regulator